MTEERITAAEYLALTARKPSHGSARDHEPNPYRGVPCRVCGRRVLGREPAQFHSENNERWVAHIACLRAERGAAV